MRIWSATSLIAALFLAACGPSVPQRSALPEDQYFLHASYAAVPEFCYSTGMVSPEDTAALRRLAQRQLSPFTYDAGALHRLTADVLAQWRSGQGNVPTQASCAENGRNGASLRADEAQNRAAQLHQAQMAAAQSAVRSSQVSNWQPQPFMMPQIPVFQAPVVQTPRLSGGSFIHCNRFGSNIISCR